MKRVLGLLIKSTGVLKQQVCRLNSGLTLEAVGNFRPSYR